MSRGERPGLSIVCVYNDPDMRRQCLDASIEAYSGPVEVEYLPIDNVSHAYSSAGAALNHGARLSHHDVVVFVHQDVYLHSIDRLAEAAGHLSKSWGMLGANGMTHDARSIGRMRDRIGLIGQSAHTPIDVDSVDEVLFMVPRGLVVQQPLTEDAQLAWHAYAVEYGLRLRTLGLRVGALDLGITHNSLTVNLAKLDVAHRAVGSRYSSMLPVFTTCGKISDGRPARHREPNIIQRNRWRVRWLQQSLMSWRIRRLVKVPVILSDIRHEVDLLDFSVESPLQVINVDRSGGFALFGRAPLELHRKGRPVIMRAVSSLAELADGLSALPEASRVVVCDLDRSDLPCLRPLLADRDWLLGIQYRAIWLLAGPDVRHGPSEWERRQATPLGLHIGRRDSRRTDGRTPVPS